MSTINRTRTLYIIAPTLHACARTALAHGLHPPAIENFRNITRAHHLRGVSAGTPFITIDRDSWADTAEGRELDAALTAYQRSGRLRIAQDDDLRAASPYDDLPSRTIRPDERAGAL